MTQRLEPGFADVNVPRLGAFTSALDSRKRRVFAPMGPQVPVDAPPFGLVMAKGSGSNVWDVEGNRYVDLAAGFGSLLLGHSHPTVVRAIESQAATLLQAMGDLFTSDMRVRLAEAVTELVPFKDAQVILGQSGADAISAALKTAVLHTGKSEFVAFHGAYHGLSWGPLALCGLRESYRAPFSNVLGTTHFLAYPDKNPEATLAQLEQLLANKPVAALVVEPILGRGGVRRCDVNVLQQLHALCARHGTLLILDEVWTGLGRCGSWFASFEPGVHPIPGDILCLGKGLGGGLPISACVAPKVILKCWSRREEVVDTSTFAGAPLACASALATLDELAQADLPRRSSMIGEAALQQLHAALSDSDVSVRGFGLMLAVDLGARPGAAVRVLSHLLDHGIIVSTGGGQREVVVLTPPLNIEHSLLDAALRQVAASVAHVVRS